MRKLANFFLLLFVLSALLTIAVELLRPVLNLSFLDNLNHSLWLLALVTGALIYIGFGFNRHLPRLILLPLFFWMAWHLLDYGPLESLMGGRFHLYVAGAQLLLGLGLLRLNKLHNHKSLFFTPGQFRGPAFNGHRLIYFCLLSIPILPIMLLLGSYAFIGQLISSNTAGFVQLKPDGLYLAERIYRQGDQQIRLTGMIHLGEEDFYSHLIDSMGGAHSLILAEGVSDKQGLMEKRFSYGKIADLLGLESQEKMTFPGRIIENLEETETTQTDTPDILSADIDLSQFDPRTLDVLNALAKYILNSDSLATGYIEFNRWAQENVSNDINQIVMNDLVGKRNRSVVNYLDKALEKYDTVIIPWGALHMKGIEVMVKKRGFQLGKTQQRRSINFLKLPYTRMIEQLVGADK